MPAPGSAGPALSALLRAFSFSGVIWLDEGESGALLAPTSAIERGHRFDFMMDFLPGLARAWGSRRLVHCAGGRRSGDPSSITK